MPFLLTLNYFLIYSSVFVVVEFQQVLLWLILINFLFFFSVQHDIKCTLIIDFNKFNLKLELFLTDPFQATVQIRVYYPTCLA